MERQTDVAIPTATLPAWLTIIKTLINIETNHLQLDSWQIIMEKQAERVTHKLEYTHTHFSELSLHEPSVTLNARSLHFKATLFILLINSLLVLQPPAIPHSLWRDSEMYIMRPDSFRAHWRWCELCAAEWMAGAWVYFSVHSPADTLNTLCETSGSKNGK